MPYAASLDLIRQIRLTPSISRAFWSSERAWPGGSVRLHVETRFVPDGIPVRLEIRSADPEVATVVHTIDDATIEDSRSIVDHTIDWSGAELTEVLAATKIFSFSFIATIEKYGLVFTSAPLYVPYEPFVP